MARRRRPLKLDRRGFSLVELAVALSIVAVLSVTSLYSAQVLLAMAREERTAGEVRTLLVAMQNAVMKQNTQTVGASADAGTYLTAESYDTVRDSPTRLFGGHDIMAGAPVCFDISCNSGSGTCWGGSAVIPVMKPNLVDDAAAAIRNVLASTSTAFTGKNAYGNTYVACVLPRRIDVMTCVPGNEIPTDLIPKGTANVPTSCTSGTATFDCPTGVACLQGSLSLVPPNLSRLAFTYRYLYWGEATTSP